MKKILPVGLSLLMLVLTACVRHESSTGKFDEPIQVVDFRGKTLRLQRPATRIVCLIESAMSGLYMLGAENRVIGVSSAVYYESAAPHYAVLDQRIKNRELPAPGNWDFVDIESLVALQPDLVLIWASQTEAIEAIEAHDIPVYGIFLKSFEDVFKEMADFGLLTDCRPRADSLIGFARQEFQSLAKNHLSSPRRSVYFVWPQSVLETSGTNSTVNELIELAGAKNSCALLQEHVVVNKEMLFEWQPDLIVFWNNPSKQPVPLLIESGLEALKAVKNNQIYELPPVFWCDLWTLKFIHAARLLAKWCYPEEFSQLDLVSDQHRLIQKLYGSKAERLLLPSEQAKKNIP